MAQAASPVRTLDGATLEREPFVAEVASRCEPVVLRGLCRDWPVVAAQAESRAALLAYLARFDAGRSAEAFIGDPAIGGRYDYADNLADFTFSRETLGFGEALRRIADAADTAGRASVYMGSLPTDSHLPGFAAENQLSVVPDGVLPRIWLGTASAIGCHYDTFDNIACVVAGQRRFTLYPPSAIANLYVGPIDHTLAGQPVSLAASAAPGDPRYPDFDAIRHLAITVDLAPGDALYLPKLWWHSVEATAPFNVLVNYWWDGFASGPDAPYTTMLLAMIAIAERPPAERAAWRAFFDHYVFRPDGHPLAHLPETQHGILGPLRQGNYGRIRALVMRLLRGG
ncbi:cupin-like domain-containing protein [Sphingomonas glacialis]|uniref:Cupin-like domain-containing protein n=1 Tax=Sphingomonas glacialis TaxID=658225 RepID=A0A502FPX1_9SPHN|nr:cupin-like domain-containing protein [Sphingomonas glacialis]TPG51598.1 cupin-like domain-containing protein [Sphingomonas glacialis]